MKNIDIRHWPTEKISKSVLYLLVSLTALLFVLFFTVGYDVPYDENPDMNAPLLTGTVIVFMMMMVAVAVVVTVVTAIRNMRRNHETANDNLIPASRISYGVAGGTVALMVLTFAVGSSNVLTVNSKPFSDWLWLKMSDMFVSTALIMIAAAVGLLVYGQAKNNARRREPHADKA